MKRLIVSTGFLILFLSSGLLAQTAANVEKAVRFRAFQEKAELEAKAVTQKVNAEEQYCIIQ